MARLPATAVALLAQALVVEAQSGTEAQSATEAPWAAVDSRARCDLQATRA
jgi:hypothetical protein